MSTTEKAVSPNIICLIKKGSEYGHSIGTMALTNDMGHIIRTCLITMEGTSAVTV